MDLYMIFSPVSLFISSYLSSFLYLFRFVCLPMFVSLSFSFSSCFSISLLLFPYLLHLSVFSFSLLSLIYFLFLFSLSVPRFFFGLPFSVLNFCFLSFFWMFVFLHFFAIKKKKIIKNLWNCINRDRNLKKKKGVGNDCMSVNTS